MVGPMSRIHSATWLARGTQSTYVEQEAGCLPIIGMGR